MKYQISNWHENVPVKSVDAEGKETTDHFVAEFKELDVPEIQQVERKRRKRARKLNQLRRQSARLNRQIDSAIDAGDDERLEKREAELAKVDEQIEELEDETADADRNLLADYLVAVHKIELTDAAGNPLGPDEARKAVLNTMHLMIPTVQAFSDGVSGAAEKNLPKSGAK